jgi:hypothetical protein
MIILFAMINSLAARENALRGATAPPDRPARGIYAEGKHEDGAASAARANGSDATALWQKVRAARIAAAAEWICNRDIVNLKQSVIKHADLQAAPLAPMPRLRSEPGHRPNPARL